MLARRQLLKRVCLLSSRYGYPLRWQQASMATMEGVTATIEAPGDPLTKKILSEHEELEALFQEYEQLPADAIPEQRQRLGHEMIRQISMHAATEEMVLYPVVAKYMGDKAGDILVDETQAVKDILAELNNVNDPKDPRLTELVQKAVQTTREHIKDEENNFLPHLAKSLNTAELSRIAKQFGTARHAAPTRPHPWAPNRPPWNLPANAAAVPLDMARDALRFGPGNLTSDVGDKKA